MDIKKIFGSALNKVREDKTHMDAKLGTSLESGDDSQLVDFRHTLESALLTDAGVVNDNGELSIESGFIDAGVQAAAAIAGGEATVKSLYSKMPDGKVSAQRFGANYDAFNETAIEHFDGRRPDLLQAANFVYNVSAASQDSFSEAFFPTVVGDITKAGFTIGIDVPHTQTEFLRTNTNPDGPKFNRTSIITAISDPEAVFGADYIKLLPVAGTTYDAVLELGFQNPNKVFYDASNEEIDTAPYKLGTTIPVMAVSQTATLLSKGVMDNTDTLDSAVVVSKLYFEVGADKIALDISRLPGSTFTYSTRGSDRDILLNTKTQFVVDLTSLTQFDGSATTEFGTVPAGYKAVFNIVMGGTGNVADGDVAVYVNEFAFAGVRDAAGKTVKVGEAGYSDVETAAKKFLAKAYDLDARITNTNLRRKGVMISSNRITEVVAVKAKSPIYADAPVAGQNYGENDSRFLNELLSFTGILMNMSAVKTIKGFADYMRNNAAGNINPSEIAIDAIGGQVFKPYFKSETIAVNNLIDSQRSAERVEDIKALITDKIADAVNDMLSTSGYNNYNEFVAKKSTTDIVVGTYSKLARYLGDTLDLGNGRNVKVVSTENLDIKNGNKLYVTVGDFNPNRSTVNVARFGSNVFIPSLITTGLVATENGATSTKSIVNPRFEHVITLPCLIEFNVTGLEESLNKVTLNTHAV